MKCLGGFPAVGDGSLLEEMGLKIWNIHTYALLKKDRLLYKLNYCNPPPKDDEPILTVFLMGWFVTCFYFKISQSLSLIIQLAQGGEGGGRIGTGLSRQRLLTQSSQCPCDTRIKKMTMIHSIWFPPLSLRKLIEQVGQGSFGGLARVGNDEIFFSEKLTLQLAPKISGDFAWRGADSALRGEGVRDF